MLKVQEFRELSGVEYLMAEIACKHDKAFEKKGWDERLAHFREIDFSDGKSFKNASNPIGLRAAMVALTKALKKEPSGYTISLDASSSGLQLLALLVECPTSWKLCGGDENILDAYAALYFAMNSNINLTRKEVKHAIMTSLYGSTATPASYFGDDIETFYGTMEVMAPGAWDLNLGLQELWDDIQGNTYDWVLPDNFYACIETSDKEVVDFTFLDKPYQVVQKVDERPRFHKGLGPNLIHSVDGLIVREMYRRCMFNSATTLRVIELIMNQTGQFVYGTEGKSAEMVETLWDHYLQSGFLSVRILDYLYEDTMGLVDPMVIAKMIKTLPDKSFEILSNHDCFRCHPNYGNDLRRQYNQIMCDIKNSNMLPFIASQVVGKAVKARKVGNIPDDVILNGNYLLA